MVILVAHDRKISKKSERVRYEKKQNKQITHKHVWLIQTFLNVKSNRTMPNANVQTHPNSKFAPGSQYIYCPGKRCPGFGLPRSHLFLSWALQFTHLVGSEWASIRPRPFPRKDRVFCSPACARPVRKLAPILVRAGPQHVQAGLSLEGGGLVWAYDYSKL